MKNALQEWPRRNGPFTLCAFRNGHHGHTWPPRADGHAHVTDKEVRTQDTRVELFALSLDPFFISLFPCVWGGERGCKEYFRLHL